MKKRTKSRRMITRAQIVALSDEAGVAGDMAMVSICDRALAGDAKCIAECARVIRAAFFSRIFARRPHWRS